MKKLLILILLLVLVCLPSTAHADLHQDLIDQVDEGLSKLDFSEVNNIIGDYIGDIVQKVKALIGGNFDSVESFLQMAIEIGGNSLNQLLPKLVSLFVVMVLVGLVRKTSGGLISTGTEEIVSFVGKAVMLVTLISLFIDVFAQVEKVICQLSALSETSMPILLTLVVANGSSNISAVCQPSMVMFSGTITGIVRNLLLPLALSAVAFAFVSSLSHGVKITKMASFLHNSSLWILGILFTLFSAFTSVQGIAAATMDGLSYRMAKFTAKNYIPILGGYISDGFDIVVASTSLIKNSFGAVLLIVVAVMVLKPLISIVSLNLGLQAVTALSEPVVADNCVEMFSGLRKCLTFLSALVVAVAFMFCILVIVAISCANGV